MPYFNHLNYADQDGNVFCKRRMKVLSIRRLNCDGCEMFRGSCQGEGVECYWEDKRVIDCQTGLYYVENPHDEWNTVTEFENKSTIFQLLDQEDEWMDREIVEAGDERNAWLDEGIRLYSHFLSIDKQEPRYSITLADLFLNLGRDEKIRRGNRERAYNTLRKATIYSPEKPDAYYHLSFLLAKEKRKWEAVLFYGKEALEKGIKGNKRIKLLCNLALGYSRLDYGQKGRDLINEAQTLDVKRENDWFIELYTDKISSQVSEPILLKAPGEKRKQASRRDLQKIKDEAIEGRCVLLDFTTAQKQFTGIKDTVYLELKQAEMLGYLIDHQMISCSKHDIESAIWLDENVGSTAVRRYIGALRDIIALAMGMEREDVKNQIVVTTENGYKWNADIPAFVIR
jgi:DNA-binding winged helix-turn-helix (wHTH) protein